MNSLTQKAVLVGIDWADQEHAWHLQSELAQNAGTLQQDAHAIDQWINRLRKQHPGGQFAIAIETTKGCLLYTSPSPRDS